jgi:CHAT domain-containing protein
MPTGWCCPPAIRRGAEALSGLARAFFYAGARALLLSHWRIDSKAATPLATSTFDIMNSNQTIGRAEALRRAMLAFAPPLSIEFQNHAAGAAREIRAN